MPPYQSGYMGCGQGGNLGYGGQAYPFNPNSGYGGLSSPYGTMNGNNGWGAANPYGYNGQYGQPSYWGSSSPFNAQMAQSQAQMYAAWAQKIAQQAQASAAAAQAYQQQLNNLNTDESKAYQAYEAYEMAQMGYGGGLAQNYQTVPSTGIPTSGLYYPPYQSAVANPGGRSSSLSLGISGSFTGSGI